MKVLILGGGSFVGPALALDALRRGWSVTCLNRGTAAPPAGTATVLADRHDPAAVASAIHRSNPDLVVDTWQGAAAAVAYAAQIVAGYGCMYGYISSRSVYAEPLPPGADERHPVVSAKPDAPGDADYAVRKRGGELAALQEVGPERATICRAGLIVGPRENSRRLIWWLARLKLGGRVLVPGPPGLALQLIDVRDLAAFTLDLLARGQCGVFDAVSVPGHTTMGEMVGACRDVTGSAAEIAWVEPSWLLAQGVQPVSEVPLWVPENTPAYGLHSSDTSRAARAGLRCRPFVETVRDTWRRIESDGAPPAGSRPVGLTAERERELLDRWDEGQ